MIFYFLIPTVKTTYFDPSIRWWEAKPRYIVSIPGKLDGENGHEDITIENISEGGIFFQSEEAIELNKVIKINFKFNDEDFTLDINPIFRRSNPAGFGCEVKINDSQLRNRLQRGILHLSHSGAKLSRPIPMWNEDLRNWLLNVFKNKKGLTPELPQRYTTK
jgi:hypothetical protein